MAAAGLAHEGDNAAFTTEAPQEIKVDAESLRALKIATAKVRNSGVDNVLRATGEVQAAETQSFEVTPAVSGMVQTVDAKQGDTVNEGKVLGTIYSIEVARVLTDLMNERTKTQAAVARVETQYKSDIELQKQACNLSKFNFERQEQLLKEGIASRKSFQEASNEYDRDKVKLATLETKRQQEAQLLKDQLAVTIKSAKGQLAIMSVKEEQVDKALNTGQVIATVPILSPVTGIITTRDITLGERVDPSKKVFSIINLNPIWINVEIFQEKIPYVHVGQPVTIRTPSKERFIGKISTIGPTVDSIKKTMHVRIVAGNPDDVLRPGMFVTAEIMLGKGLTNRLSVPAEAVIEDRGRHMVFIKHQDHFEPVFIEPGLETADGVEVMAGLSADDEIVVSGAHQLLAASIVNPNRREHEHENHEDHHEHEKSQAPDNQSAHTLLIFAAGVASALVIALVLLGAARLFGKKGS